jgi:putative MATE family efflux protein
VTTSLTTGPVAGHLRRQAAPMALGLVAIFSFDAVDLFFISQLGDAPLAAVSFTFPAIWLLVGIGIGFEAGASSCVSRAVGRGDQKLARRLTTDTAVLATLVAFVLCVIGLFTIRPVFSLLGATEELMPLIEDYMRIWYWLEPAETCMWTCLAAVRARGNTILPSKIITIAALLNCALDPIFIFGLFGFPRLEIQGAALASLVANLVMLSFTLFHLHHRMGVFANPIAPLQEIWESWLHMLKIGVPAMITNAIVPVSNGIVVAMIATYGVDAVAGFGIAMRIEPMALIPFYALSAVSSPFAGQNFAAGEYQRLFEARRATTWFCIGFGVLLAVVLSLVAKPLAGVFSQTDAIRQVTVQYLWIVSASYGAYGLVMSTCASFNGIGTPFPAVVISVSRVIFIFLPLAFIGRWLFDLQGLFIASALANLTVGIWAYVWLGQRISGHQASVWKRM